MCRYGPWTVVILLLIALVPAPASAQATGAISGMVTAVATSAPLANIGVRIYAAPRLLMAYARTDASGAYTGGSLPSGTYYVVTDETFPYFPELYNDLPCPGSQCAPTAGTGVTVTAGETTTGIDFALQLGGTIAGTVTDAATGAPLAGITVKVMTSGGDRSAITDASGAYAVTGLATYSYYVWSMNSSPYIDELFDDIPCPDNQCRWWDGTAVEVTAGVATTNIDLALTHGGTIAGTITEAGTGTPLAGMRVDVYNEYGGWLNACLSDASGAYSLSGLTTGKYYLKTLNAFPYLDELYKNLLCLGGSCQVTAGTAIDVTAGQTTTGIDFHLQTGGTITGTVTDAVTNAPLSNISVGAYYADGTSTGGAIGTNLAGVYTIGGLPTGTYYVRTGLSAPYFDELYNDIVCPNGNCSLQSGTAVIVAVGSTTSGIDFALQSGGTITGTVQDAATGAPIADVFVHLCSDSGSCGGGGVLTNVSGAYTMGGLAPGTYYLRAASKLPYLGELYNNLPCPGGNCTVTDGTPVGVTVGTTTSGINFTLAVGGTITGKVMDAGTEAPLANIPVSAYSASNPRGDQVGQGWTNASGSYAINGLATGTYFVITSNGNPYRDELYDNLPCQGGCDVTDGTGVSVTAGATTGGINFALDRSVVISGTVRNEAGAPIASVVVMVLNATGAAAGQAVTDASGSYSVPFLEPGSYYVRTLDALPYLGQLYEGKPCSPSCLVTSGTLVTVSLNHTASGIDFSVSTAGSIAGNVRQGVAGPPLADVQVTVFNASGAWAGSSTTDASGTYAVNGLAPGTWYVRASRGLPFLDQMYDGRSCMGADCTPANGTGVGVMSDSVTGGIDFGLRTAARSDFNGNLKSDVLWRHESGGDLWLWPMDGATRLSESYVRTIADTNWEVRALGDLDASATADLIWRNKVTGEVYVWPMNGAAPSAELYVATVDPAYDVVGTGDFNGDGKADLLWQHATTGDVWIWLMDSYTPTSKTFVARVDPAYVIKGVGDLDGDSKADIVWHHATLGEVWVWPMHGTTRLDQVWVGTVPDTGYQIQGVADVTGDLKADLLWHHATRGEVWIWTMNGTSRQAETWVGTVPDTDYQIAGTGDYDGDGQADLLWRNGVNGEVWVWLMNGTTPISQTWVATVPELEYRIVKEPQLP